MQKFGLVCEKKSTKGDGRIFYVLSRLKPEHVDRKPIFHNGKGAISLFHGFAGYLPDDFFQRAATKFIEKFQMEDIQPELSYEHVELDVDEHHHVILDVATIKHCRMFQTTIARRKIINTDRPTEDDEPLPSLCQEVLRFLETELQVFSPRGARGVELKMYIPCVCSNDAHMHVVRKFDKDVLPCGSNGMEVTRYRKLFGKTVPSQDVPQSQLELTKPNGYVDDIIIAQVSEEIGHCWKILGVRLGHKWSKLNSLGYERQIDKATEYMLKQWRCKRSGDNQIAVLCNALKQHGLKDLASRYQNDTGSDSNPQDIVKNSDNFDDQDLLFICENLGSGWRRLALRLGAKWTDLNDIEDQHRYLQDRMMNALDSWRQRQPANQLPTMIIALRHEHNNLAKLLCTRHVYKYDVAFKDKPVTEDHSRQGSLSDLDFLVISEMMEKDWKSFLRHLGIKDAQLAQIEVKFPGDIVGQTIESLVRWRNGQDSDVNQVEKVKEALKAEGRMDIIEKLEAAERNRDA
ncbi:uncharacterized protein [Antedon mediterranea]|uniref:uncharacterized protein n=1 Tax=Antedon mediterranea TaxID=105859 RepID=UPI003AF71C30